MSNSTNVPRVAPHSHTRWALQVTAASVTLSLRAGGGVGTGLRGGQVYSFTIARGIEICHLSLSLVFPESCEQNISFSFLSFFV